MGDAFPPLPEGCELGGGGSDGGNGLQQHWSDPLPLAGGSSMVIEGGEGGPAAFHPPTAAPSAAAASTRLQQQGTSHACRDPLSSSPGMDVDSGVAAPGSSASPLAAAPSFSPLGERKSWVWWGGGSG